MVSHKELIRRFDRLLETANVPPEDVLGYQIHDLHRWDSDFPQITILTTEQSLDRLAERLNTSPYVCENGGPFTQLMDSGETIRGFITEIGDYCVRVYQII